MFCPGTKEWNKELIQQILPHEASDILCIKPSTTRASDTYSWTLTSNGDYSTKSGYYTTLNSTYPAEPTTTNQARCNWIKDIWTLPLPPKISVFFCKAIRGALPLGSNFEMRGITTNTGFVFYEMGESVDHMFLSWKHALLRKMYGQCDQSQILTPSLQVRSLHQHSKHHANSRTFLLLEYILYLCSLGLFAQFGQLRTKEFLRI